VQLGLVGLGRMGANMRERLRAGGIEVLGFARHAQHRDVASLAELAERLSPPRAVWIMVPAGEATRDTVTQLAGLLTQGDLVIDGGNSCYSEDQHHAELLAQAGIGYLDCGVSSGVWGRHNGYGLMVGGAAEHVERLMPVFDVLRPEGPRDEGFVHAGHVGAGHFAKMVHNGVEYSLMRAYAEGFELLHAAEMITDVPAVLKAWWRGTVVRSWLLNLLVAAVGDTVEDDPKLAPLRGCMPECGEGRWNIEEAINQAVPAPVISAALVARFASGQSRPGEAAATKAGVTTAGAMRAVAALRQQFSGQAGPQANPESSRAENHH
jgi:6-phosphogluconate dehydrogenase